MAKSGAIPPTWVRTLGSMLDDPGQVTVTCTLCRRFKLLLVSDLVALAEIKGRSYSLINRRCRCRMTVGCEGWNRFHYLHGVARPLWDDATSWRWFTEQASG
jgi:hypothetical protein